MTDAWERVGQPRAISPAVWDERGLPVYWVVRGDNGTIIEDGRGVVRAAYAALSPAQRQFTTRTAGKSDGILIQRYPPPGLGLPPIYPEMRPDHDVLVGLAWLEPHRHDLERRVFEWERKRRRAFTLSEARYHIVRHPDHGNMNASEISNEEIRKLTLADVRAIYESGRLKGTHRHRDDPTHYVFAKGKDPNGRGLASRIDVHPLAATMLEGAEYVFFSIEGCLKADSILTGIREEGLSASVFSVPAVWLWKRAYELREFAWRYLVGKPVIIVPDADWKTKYEVREAARECKTLLENLGIRCCVAAPPYDPDDLDPKDGKPVQNGVDDYRHHGGKLLGLRVRERERTPLLALAILDHDYGGLLEAAGLVDGARRNTSVLDNATIAHDALGQLHDGGKVRRTIRKGAREAGINKNRYTRGVEFLEQHVYGREDGSMELVYDTYTGEWRYELVPTLVPPPIITPKDKPEIDVAEWLQKIEAERSKS